jgi:hypothetical protein
MREDLLRALRKPFSNIGEPTLMETKWLGEPIANGFEFRAQSTDGLAWQGEAYTVAHKGIAYYWLGWCGENDFDSLKSEFAAFRDKFKLLDMRKDWTPTAANVFDYKGDKVHYTISDAAELWKEVPANEYTDLKTAEPNLDRRLRTSKSDRKTQPVTAELSVYILDSTGDPLQEARKYTEDMETARIKTANAEFAPPKIEELTDAAQGDPAPTTVPATTPYVRLKSTVAEAKGQARLFVASGLKVGDKIVVVHCSCDLDNRKLFETKFVQIASSLRPSRPE